MKDKLVTIKSDFRELLQVSDGILSIVIILVFIVLILTIIRFILGNKINYPQNVHRCQRKWEPLERNWRHFEKR